MTSGGQLDGAFAAMKKARIEAVAIQPLFIGTLGLGLRVAALASQHRLLSVSDGDGFAEHGGLLFYGPDPAAMYRRVAYYTDRVLKGARPAEFPVEQPLLFLVTVNLKTAKLLGVKIPHSITGARRMCAKPASVWPGCKPEKPFPTGKSCRKPAPSSRAMREISKRNPDVHVRSRAWITIVRNRVPADQ